MSKATQDWDQTARKCCLLSSVRHLRKKHSILLIPFAQQVMGAKAPWKPFQFTKSSQGTIWHATTIHTSSTPSDCPNAPVELGPAGRISAAAPAVPPATGEILSHSLGRWMSQWWTEVSKRSKWLCSYRFLCASRTPTPRPRNSFQEGISRRWVIGDSPQNWSCAGSATCGLGAGSVPSLLLLQLSCLMSMTWCGSGWESHYQSMPFLPY